MMDGMDSIRRTIYDKFGNVMKTFKLDLDSRGRSETIDQSPIDIGSEPIETTGEPNTRGVFWGRTRNFSRSGFRTGPIGECFSNP